MNNPHHVFMVLTKRPEKMKELLGKKDILIPRHIWLGVTVENQAWADERIPILLSIPAAVHFVSVEPMLESVDLTQWFGLDDYDDPNYMWPSCLDWVIAGPETGPGARPCNPEWIEDLHRQCQDTLVPFFDKRENYIAREWPK